MHGISEMQVIEIWISEIDQCLMMDALSLLNRML